MKVIKVTKEYFETEDEKVYFFEPLGKEILVDDLQKIVDANEKLVKELKGGVRRADWIESDIKTTTREESY